MLIAVSLVFNAGSVMAEHSGEFFIGLTNIADEKVEGSITYSGGSVESASTDEEFNNSLIIGGGYKYWIESVGDSTVDLGLGAGGSYFKAEIDNADFDVFPLTLSLWLRGNFFTEDDSGRGKLQPYAGLGLSYAFVNGTVHQKPALSETVSGTGNGSGPMLAIGVRSIFWDSMSLFVELRHYILDVSIENEDSDFFGIWVKTKEADTELKMTSILVGLAF